MDPALGPELEEQAVPARRRERGHEAQPAGVGVDVEEREVAVAQRDEMAAGAEVRLDHDRPPVAVEDHLGAKGHLVALREGDLAFLHVHPDEDALRFMAEFPSAGRYRLFLQFRHAGSVHTAALTQEVATA